MRRPSFRRFALLAALSLIVISCGSDDSETSTDSDSDSEAAETLDGELVIGAIPDQDPRGPGPQLSTGRRLPGR